jgi:DNA excision repair protein ERCC-2
MGGVFAEGIDLVGDKLIGAVVVGIGLPQICHERDLIKDYHFQNDEPGFAYAYAYPGFNKIIQAVGRIIRTKDDKGAALLIGRRFTHSIYRDLVPPFWKPIKYVRGPREISDYFKVNAQSSTSS